MPLCQKCKKFLPPGLVHTEHPKSGEPLNGSICLFCIDNIKSLKTRDDRIVTKNEIEREYDIFLKQIKENNELIKEGAKGKFVKNMDRIIY